MLSHACLRHLDACLLSSAAIIKHMKSRFVQQAEICCGKSQLQHGIESIKLAKSINLISTNDLWTVCLRVVMLKCRYFSVLANNAYNDLHD